MIIIKLSAVCERRECGKAHNSMIVYLLLRSLASFCAVHSHFAEKELTLLKRKEKEEIIKSRIKIVVVKRIMVSYSWSMFDGDFLCV